MPEEPDIGRVLQLSRARSNRAYNTAVDALDSDPDEAARADSLGRATGVPSSLINMDQESFERQHKAGIVGNVLRTNRELQGLLEEDPIFAKVGADDWAQTARVAEAAKKHILQGFPDIGFGSHGPMDRTEFAAAKSFMDTYSKDMEQSYGPLQEEYEKATPYVRPFLYYMRRGVDVGAAALHGASQFVHEGVAQAGREAGLSEEYAQWFAKGAAEITEWKATDMAAGGIAVHPEIGHAMQMRFNKAMEFAKPYIDAGERPPVGVDRLVDAAYALQAKIEAASIEALLNEAHRSKIKERDPDMMVKMLRKYYGEKNVALPYDAVENVLYGDKETPHSGDGKLGDIPGFIDKYNDAVLTGGDIEVPIAEYIGRIDPETREVLREHLKPDPRGMNLEQADETAKTPIDLDVPGPPIVRFRRQADEITRALPPVEEGMTRLWRGNRPGELGVSPSFTSSLEGIALPFRESYGGPLSYVDVPTADLSKMRTGAGATEAEFTLTPELAAKAKAAGVPPTKLTDTVRDSAGFNELMPEQIYAGLDERTKERFIQLAERLRLDDLAWEMRKAGEEISKVRTAQWREGLEAMRPQAAFDVSARPEWVAHEWLKNGVLRGKSGELLRLDPKYLTREQEKLFPKEYLRYGAYAPDDAARMAGFRSGDEMIDVMNRFYQEKGDLSPTEYFERVVDDELSRRMEAEYGKLPDAILAETQDHALSQLQVDRQWLNTVGIAERAGVEPPYSKEGLELAVKNTIAKKSVGELNREKYIRSMADSGKKMAKAFLKGDFVEALKYAQKQHAATVAGREVRRILQEKNQFEKLAKRFSKSEIKGYDNPFSGPYVPYIQSILARIGRRIDRTQAQLVDALGQGDYAGLTLAKFVERKGGELKAIDLPPWLHEGYNTPVEKMSVEEWEDVHRAIKDLATAGREEGVVYIEGEAKDSAEVKAGMIEQIKKRGVVKVDPTKKPGVLSRVADVHAEHLTVESTLNRIDEDDPMGLHNQVIVRQIVGAVNHESRLIRYYDKALQKAMGPLRDGDKIVPNTIWKNQTTGEPFVLKKRDVVAIHAYWGSPSSRMKLLGGYNVPEDVARRWLFENTSKEDWDRMQKIGQIFNRLIKEADEMRIGISGSPVKKIELTPIDTPHGQYDGWYNQIDYSSYFPGRAAISGKGLLEGIGFRGSLTPLANYAKERTGKIAPIQISLDAIPHKMREMIHDIALRPALLQAAKIFTDPEWQQTMINYYGKRYNDQMIPWLKDIANYYNKNADWKDQVIENFRQNLINTMIGLNPHTVMKHGITAAANSMREVGLVGFLKHTRAIVGLGGDQSWSFAMDASEELQRRVRNWTELAGLKPDIALQKAGMRQALGALGSKPVAWFDLMSAVPTWLARYEDAMGRGVGEGQAVFEADRAVRRAHGSSAISNIAGIGRTNSTGKFYTSLYGFFSHMYQKQFEMSWKARDAWVAGREGDFTKLQKYWKDIGLGFFSYVMVPAMVEEAVTPYLGSEQDSTGMKMAKVFAYGATSSIIGVRDVVHGLVNMTEPTAGIQQSFFHQTYKLARDLSSGRWDEKTTGHMLAESFFIMGALTGYVNAEEGRVAEYMYRWYHGAETPKDIWDIISPWKGGLFVGETDRPQRRRHY